MAESRVNWPKIRNMLGISKNLSFDRVVNKVIRDKFIAGNETLDTLSEVFKISAKLRDAGYVDQAVKAEEAKRALQELKAMMGTAAFEWIERNS